MKDATGPLAQSAERGADITLRLRRGREFEPLTDQKIFFLIPFCRISIYILCLLYKLDCKTVVFFLEISNCASFETFCLTARAYLNTQKYGLCCSLLYDQLVEEKEFEKRILFI